jgi:hypothetical protein
MITDAHRAQRAAWHTCGGHHEQRPPQRHCIADHCAVVGARRTRPIMTEPSPVQLHLLQGSDEAEALLRRDEMIEVLGVLVHVDLDPVHLPVELRGRRIDPLRQGRQAKILVQLLRPEPLHRRGNHEDPAGKPPSANGIQLRRRGDREGGHGHPTSMARRRARVGLSKPSRLSSPPTRRATLVTNLAHLSPTNRRSSRPAR